MMEPVYCRRVFILMLFSVALSVRTVCANTSSGHAVYDALFTNNSDKSYNKNVRPVKDWTTPTNVNVSVAVIAIVDFNEVKQTIVLTSKLSLSWIDEYLTWDPALHDNVTHLHTPQSMVWRPSILLENSVAKQEDFGSSSLKVIITNDGIVTWEPVEVFYATCAADVRKFPFDTQKCSMVFEAMGYSGNEMQIVSVEDHVDFHGFGGVSGWAIIDTHMEAEADSDGPTHLTCSLTMKRNPTYFILNIFLPIVLLSFMNICVFILPVQSGEKASFVITVFLSMAVFLTIVSSNLPENSDTISLLNVYVFISTLLSVIIAILTICQIRIYHKHESIPVPGVLKNFAFKFTSKASYKNTTPVLPLEQNGNVTKGSRRTSVASKHNTDGISTLGNNAKVVTWPDVARAFDNMFLLVFLMINVIMTAVIFAIAIENEEVDQENHGH